MRSARSLLLLLGGVLILLLAVGCGSEQETAKTPAGGTGSGQVLSGEIKIEATEYSFKPNSITVRAGAPVKFTVTNMGKVEHNLGFPDLVGKVSKARTDTFEAGKSQTLEVTFSQAGEYRFDCSIAGHAASGMKGTVTVVQ